MKARLIKKDSPLGTAEPKPATIKPKPASKPTRPAQKSQPGARAEFEALFTKPDGGGNA